MEEAEVGASGGQGECWQANAADDEQVSRLWVWFEWKPNSSYSEITGSILCQGVLTAVLDPWLDCMKKWGPRLTGWLRNHESGDWLTVSNGWEYSKGTGKYGGLF